MLPRDVFLTDFSFEKPAGLFMHTSSGLEYVPIDVTALMSLAYKVGRDNFRDMIEDQLGLVNKQLDGVNPFHGGLLPIHSDVERKGIENAKTLYERLLQN